MVYNITLNDYEFVDGPDASTYYVKMRGGAYDGVTVHYGKVSATVNEDEESATLHFDFEIVKGEEILMQNTDFNQKVGAVLEHIIQNAFDSGNYQLGNKDDDTDATNNNTEEPA